MSAFKLSQHIGKYGESNYPQQLLYSKRASAKCLAMVNRTQCPICTNRENQIAFYYGQEKVEAKG